MASKDCLYPQLDVELNNGDNFRLQKINLVLYKFNEDYKHYEGVRKKYSRTRSIVQATAVTTGSLSAILTVSGIGTSLTGPGIIVGVPLSAIGGFFGLVSAVFGIATKKLTKKISKHERTIQLIKSKQNSIADIVSKALKDNKIDDKEFELILNEVEKYNKLKASIRELKNIAILKNDPNVNIEQLKEQWKKEMVNQLVNPKN